MTLIYSNIVIDQIFRKCIPDNEIRSVLSFCHDQACAGHFSEKKTAAKVLPCGLYWPTLFKDATCTTRVVLGVNSLEKSVGEI